MTVRAQFVVSAVFAAATVGLATQSAHTEPLKASGIFRSIQRADHASTGVAWNVTAVNISGRIAKRDRTRVASATSRLDLSKLTMADFGDAE